MRRPKREATNALIVHRNSIESVMMAADRKEQAEAQARVGGLDRRALMGLVAKVEQQVAAQGLEPWTCRRSLIC